MDVPGCGRGAQRGREKGKKSEAGQGGSARAAAGGGGRRRVRRPAAAPPCTPAPASFLTPPRPAPPPAVAAGPGRALGAPPLAPIAAPQVAQGVEAWAAAWRRTQHALPPSYRPPLYRCQRVRVSQPIPATGEGGSTCTAPLSRTLFSFPHPARRPPPHPQQRQQQQHVGAAQDAAQGHYSWRQRVRGAAPRDHAPPPARAGAVGVRWWGGRGVGGARPLPRCPRAPPLPASLAPASAKPR